MVKEVKTIKVVGSQPCPLTAPLTTARFSQLSHLTSRRHTHQRRRSNINRLSLGQLLDVPRCSSSLRSSSTIDLNVGITVYPQSIDAPNHTLLTGPGTRWVVRRGRRRNKYSNTWDIGKPTPAKRWYCVGTYARMGSRI